MIDLANKKIAVSTHYLIYSASQALRDFLKEKGATVYYISHPLPGMNPDKKERSYIEISKGKKIVKRKKAQYRFNNILLAIPYELIVALKWLVTSKDRCDVYIGIDNFNALVGLILKLLGKTDKVIYYTIDYFPTRYENKILNNLYHFIDKVCVKYADETWNVSNKMIAARKKFNGMDPKTYNHQFEVPMGIWFKNAPRKSFGKINKHKIIFVGHLLKHMGVDLAVESLPLVIKKIPQVKLEIIGGGDELESLKVLSKKLNITDNITFWGWIRDRKKLEEIMSDGAIGLATFNTNILDSKVKNADPGKIKDYMLLGMPVIVTDAISTGKILTEKKCAIVIPYEKKALANALSSLLMNQEKLAEYRANALSYIEQFDFGKIFEKNLERVFKNG